LPGEVRRRRHFACLHHKYFRTFWHLETLPVGGMAVFCHSLHPKRFDVEYQTPETLPPLRSPPPPLSHSPTPPPYLPSSFPPWRTFSFPLQYFSFLILIPSFLTHPGKTTRGSRASPSSPQASTESRNRSSRLVEAWGCIQSVMRPISPRLERASRAYDSGRGAERARGEGIPVTDRVLCGRLATDLFLASYHTFKKRTRSTGFSISRALLTMQSRGRGNAMHDRNVAIPLPPECLVASPEGKPAAKIHRSV